LKEKDIRNKSSSTSKDFYLQTPEGLVLQNSSVARYIAGLGQGDLAGKNAWERALIN
jgi:hypothetical protein